LFFTLSLAFIAFGFALVVLIDKGEMVLLLNSIHTPELNQFFKLVTQLGEWIGGVLVGLALLLFAQRKYFVVFLISIGLSSLSAQLLKREVYPNEKRPAAHIEELNEIADFERHIDYTFPSGHTTAAFTFYTIVALSFASMRLQVFSFVLAFLVGLSRIYLGQHFLHDVVAGAVLGIVICTLTAYLLLPWLEKKSTWNKVLIKLSK
jgi:membrane-associated phospholipid phosphatase